MGAIQKVGKFLGVDKFAGALASTGRILTGKVKDDIENQTKADASLQRLTYVFKNEKDPEKKNQLKMLIQSQLNNSLPTPQQIDPNLNLSNKEVFGSGANVALNTALPGSSKGSKVAVLAKNAALGAGFGTASGLEKNRDVAGILGSTVGGALVGAGIGAVGLGAKAAKNFTTKVTPEWMMNNAIKPALQDLKKNIKDGSDTLGKELLDEGVKGGARKLLKIADTKQTALEDELQSILNHKAFASVRIKKQDLFPYVKDIIDRKKKVPGLSGDVLNIKKIYNSLKNEMTLPEANEVKREIYQELRDSSYKLDAKLSAKAQSLKQIARGLKKEIEKSFSKTSLAGKVEGINKKLSIYGRLENSMVDQLARDMKNNGISLTDAILLGGGQSGWLAILRNLGVGAETYAAQGLKKVGEGLESGVAKGIKDQVIKRGTINIP